MSYWTKDYVFGQHDKDALQRIHADKIMIETSSTIQDTRIIMQSKIASTDTKSLLNTAADLLRDADSEYSKMNYASAVEKALQAREQAKSAHQKIMDAPSLEQEVQSLQQRVSELEAAQAPPADYTVYLVIGLVVGAVIGCVAVWVMLRRRTK
jgi:subtilase family serine protease